MDGRQGLVAVLEVGYIEPEVSEPAVRITDLGVERAIGLDRAKGPMVAIRVRIQYPSRACHNKGEEEEEGERIRCHFLKNGELEERDMGLVGGSIGCG